MVFPSPAASGNVRKPSAATAASACTRSSTRPVSTATTTSAGGREFLRSPAAATTFPGSTTVVPKDAASFRLPHPRHPGRSLRSLCLDPGEPFPEASRGSRHPDQPRAGEGSSGLGPEPGGSEGLPSRRRGLWIPFRPREQGHRDPGRRAPSSCASASPPAAAMNVMIFTICYYAGLAPEDGLLYPVFGWPQPGPGHGCA